MDTGAGYYSDMDVVYYGVVAEDTTTFDLSQYFFSAAQFIEETLSNPQSKTTEIKGNFSQISEKSNFFFHLP